jgi:uncharacterized RDD family membrane protein YckC
MFTIIGGDGREYGPATAAQIRAWVASGRANLDTRARAAGSDEWRTVGDFAELFSSDGSPPVAATPPAAAGPAVAERWRRCFGALADGALETLCWLPTSTAMMHAMASMVSIHKADPGALVAAFWHNLGPSLPWLGGLLAVQIILLTVRSQSVGNLLSGTRIVRIGDGAPGGFLRAFLLRGCLARVLRQLPLLGPIFWIVDSLFIFRADKRCLHDLIAGTKVVNVR